MELEAFQKRVLEQAAQEGFSESELYYEGKNTFEVLVLDGEISHYETSGQQGICFRGRYQGKMGYASSSAFDEETVGYLLREAKENAEIIEETAEERILAGSPVYPTIQNYNEALAQLSPAAKMQAAKLMEEAALQEYDQVASIDYCLLETEEQTIGLFNSKGLSLCHKKNGISAYVCVIAQQNGDVKTGAESWQGNDWQTFDPKATGRQAAQRAVSHLGAYSLESGEYHVLLENQVMAEILSVFAPVFYGEQVQKGFSLLKGRLKDKIASSKVTIRDDGLLEGETGSVPFDGEGIAVKNKVVVANGKLETFLYNNKSAQQDDTQSTGNGFKGNYKSAVKTKCTNFYIQPGEKTPSTLMAQLKEGLLITDITGLHAGANVVSGDFSLSAEGFWVERGQIVRPVEQITIGGNFYTLLRAIEEVGNDLKFIQPTATGTMGAPMVMIKRLSVAGI